MNARQKPSITSAKYPSLKAVFGQKLKNKADTSKLQTFKVTIERLAQNTLQRKSSTTRVDERAFKENSKNKSQMNGLSIKETVELETRELAKRIQHTRQSVERSFGVGSQNNRQVINGQKDEKTGVRVLQKQSPKIKKLISQGLVPKNIITKQLQNNTSTIQVSNLKSIINPRATFRRLGNGNPNSQNINTINLNNNPTKGRNDARQISRNSKQNRDKAGNSSSTFLNEKDSSSITLLKSQKAKTKVINAEPRFIPPSSAINRNLNLAKNKTAKQKLIESFDYDIDIEDSFEGKNLNCDEAIMKNRYHLKTEIHRRDEESEEDIEIESEDDEEEEMKQFVHEVFENLYDSDTVNYLISQEEAYKTKADYLERCQKNVTWTMRAILLDWMQEVCSDYLFKRETFHYAVNYVDRYLTAIPHIDVKYLQLIGLGALFLAAKMEEVYTPKIDNIVTAANNSYSQSQVRSTELKLYKVS